MECYIAFLLVTMQFGNFACESFDSAIADVSEREFAKDITSLIVESTLKSKCDGNVFVVSPACEKYLDHALISIRDWAPPHLVVKLKPLGSISKDEKDSWTKYLSWERRSCSIIFICNLRTPLDVNDNEMLEDMYDNTADKDLDLGYVNFPAFITSLDQVLYLSESMELRTFDEYGESNISESCVNEDRENMENKLLKKAGLMLSINVQLSTDMPEAIMDVYSRCDLCSEEITPHEVFLGQWQRNKTHFGKFVEVFDNSKNQTFNNSLVYVGYFDYFPHFTCTKQNGTTVSKSEEKCSGIEWETVSQLGKSLSFRFNLVHVGIEFTNMQRGIPIHVTNFSSMITALQENAIDIAVGGITATSERISLVDFSRVFANEPIVFVVEKPKNIFILGVWLAFRPQVWPLIILLIAIMSFLFLSVSNETPTKFKQTVQLSPAKLSMSILLDEAIVQKRRPLVLTLFEALETTLQPMLGQPLNRSRVSSRPRRFKMLLILWWFSCLIITTFYSTSLITSLINPVITKEPESLQDLIDSGYHFKLGGRHAAVYELISATGIDPQLDLDTKSPTTLGLEHNEKMFKLLKQIRERLITGSSESYNLIAYIIEESGINGLEKDVNIGLTNMMVIRERLLLTGYSFALKPQAHYKRKVDTALARLNAGGLIDHWTSTFIDKRPVVLERKFRLRDRLGQIKLDLKILQGAFILFILGFSLSGIVFCLEHWAKRYRFQFYTKKELISFLQVAAKGVTQFYYNHMAESTEAKAKKNQEKFRRVVNTVVKIRSEQKHNFLK